MSDLLNQASLVMVPSGYKEDTVYSVVPSDGSGDLSFTRASNGTRVNSAGLVEVCPWNLLNYSEQLDNAAWAKNNSVGSAPIVTANDTTAPNGTMTADKIVFSSGTGTLNGVYSYLNGGGTGIDGLRTASVWLKSASGTPTIYITTQDDTTGGNYTTCVLSTEWKRFEVSYTTAPVGAQSILIGYYTTSGTPSGPSGSLTVYAWGAQINYGTLKPYFPTTDRLNVPRLTYQNGGGGCPSLLLEKQSTNLCTYSEDLSNGVYTQVNVSVSANTSVSPDGTTNADTITSSAASPQLISPAVSFASSTNVSLFVKYVSQKYVQLFSGGAFGDYVNFDIESGAVGSNGGTTTNAQIQSFGNGWYRVSATFGGYTGATTGRIGFVDSLSASWNALTSTTSKSIYGWGFQIEASSYPTSYIPTTSSSATRVADACSKTGISSLIGQTEGVLFADIDFKANTGEVGIIMEITSGAGSQRVLIYYSSTTILCYANTGVFSYSQTTSERLKIAFAYKSGDSALYVNGIQKAVSSASLSYSSLSQLNIGSNFTNDQPTNSPTNQAVLFKTRLTNAELASLTTI